MPLPGVTVTVIVGGHTYTTTTNADGFYLINYKTGKTQSYTIVVTGFSQRSGTINANKFVVNNYQQP
jgi:phosphatidate phosphatase APP1